MPDPLESVATFGIQTVEGAGPAICREDLLAVEEPLEIRIGYAGPDRWTTSSLSITMRTPGHDFELAAGFLLGEGIVSRPEDIAAIRVAGREESNVVRVDLKPDVRFDPGRFERHFYTTSSCGVCGKTSLDALSSRSCAGLPRDTIPFPAALIHALPTLLRERQTVFGQTGGLHGAALFRASGEQVAWREDVGRHNAVDKVIGSLFLQGRAPLNDMLLMVSGRASFELAQKALAAGIPILAAVGAPSSLAVDLAREFDMTLLGFVRKERFNIYSGDWRISYETTVALQLDPAPADTQRG